MLVHTRPARTGSSEAPGGAAAGGSSRTAQERGTSSFNQQVCGAWPENGEIDLLEFANEFFSKTSLHLGKDAHCKLNSTAIEQCGPFYDKNGAGSASLVVVIAVVAVVVVGIAQRDQAARPAVASA